MLQSAVRGTPRSMSCGSARSRKPDDNNNGHPTHPLVDANSKGLPTFALELHLEILAHLDCEPTPWINGEGDGHRERFCAILALSSTCRGLYRMYSPLFWRRVEARGWRRHSSYRTWYRHQDLRAYCWALSQMPHRAEQVQYVYSMGWTVTRY